MLKCYLGLLLTRFYANSTKRYANILAMGEYWLWQFLAISQKNSKEKNKHGINSKS